jgi:hypothetical protein
LKWTRWIARIGSLPIIVYALLLFAGYAWNAVTTGKADPHAVEGGPPAEALAPVFLFLAVLGLMIAWRWERLGGAITLAFVFATLVVLLVQRPIFEDFPRSAMPYVLTAGVAVPGALFLLCGRPWRRRSGPGPRGE